MAYRFYDPVPKMIEIYSNFKVKRLIPLEKKFSRSYATHKI